MSEHFFPHKPSSKALIAQPVQSKNNGIIIIEPMKTQKPLVTYSKSSNIFIP
jgi:hypothetical protein